MNLYEIIGIIAGLSAAIPTIPQIFQTIKSKNVEGLSISMFCIRFIGGICWIIYGNYLKSWQMVVFNSISTISSGIMIILILKYRKRNKKKQ